MNRPLEPPICAVCGHRVMFFQQVPNPADRTLDVIARCHGEEERFSLNMTTVMDAGPGGIRIGVAFSKSKLLASAP